MALIVAARTWLTTELANGTADRIVDDIRNVSPPCTIVGPPTLRGIRDTVAELDFPVSVVSAPPDTANATLSYLQRADAILAVNSLTVVDGRPGVYVVGQQELPAYTLTVRVTYAADPEGD